MLFSLCQLHLTPVLQSVCIQVCTRCLVARPDGVCGGYAAKRFSCRVRIVVQYVFHLCPAPAPVPAPPRAAQFVFYDQQVLSHPSALDGNPIPRSIARHAVLVEWHIVARKMLLPCKFNHGWAPQNLLGRGMVIANQS